MASTFLISLLALSSSSLALPTLQATSIFSRDTGSSTLPYCQYNDNDNTKGHGQCPDENWGSPNPDYCQQSINFVCLALSQQPAANNSIWGYQTGTGVIDGNSADCYAGANNGKGATSPVDFNTCFQAFSSLRGCAESTNENFNAGCIGSTINLQFNTNNGHSGSPVNANLPSYALSTPKFFGVDATMQSFDHPDPELADDTTDQSLLDAQESKANGGGGAAGAAGAEPNEGVNEEAAGGARSVVAVGFGVPSDGE